jgi:glycosyltransferase involved in cell wall biosynthesis
MRILYHHRTQAEDGQAVHIRALIGAFRALGHEVHEHALVARSEAGPKAAAGAARLGWLARAPRFARELAEYGYGVYARAGLARAARGVRPDFVYERYAFGNTAGVRMARALALPLVLEVNSPMVLELGRTRGLAFPGLARRVENGIFRAATRVCAVTGVLGEMLVELGVARERLLITPNGVELARYAYDADARARARAALQLAPEASGELVLGFVGFYRDWHRLDLVLEALRAPELAAAHLVLVGEGPARAELEQRARSLGIVARVHFVGSRPHAEVPTLLPAFDLGLVPAINPYASPLKLFEYMAAGLAVVAPDQPNLREVLRHEREALLVPPAAPEPLRAALVRLALDRELRTRLGQAARARVCELELTWEANARRVCEAVRALGAERERAGRGTP